MFSAYWKALVNHIGVSNDRCSYWLLVYTATLYQWLQKRVYSSTGYVWLQNEIVQRRKTQTTERKEEPKKKLKFKISSKLLMSGMLLRHFYCFTVFIKKAGRLLCCSYFFVSSKKQICTYFLNSGILCITLPKPGIWTINENHMERIMVSLPMISDLLLSTLMIQAIYNEYMAWALSKWAIRCIAIVPLLILTVQLLFH